MPSLSRLQKSTPAVADDGIHLREWQAVAGFAQAAASHDPRMLRRYGKRMTRMGQYPAQCPRGRPQPIRTHSIPHFRAFAIERHRGGRVHSISNFLSLLAVRVARDERQEIVQRHGEITPGAALCIAVECAAVISEPGLFDR
jgi:hypothetical protein